MKRKAIIKDKPVDVRSFVELREALTRFLTVIYFQAALLSQRNVTKILSTGRKLRTF